MNLHPTRARVNLRPFRVWLNLYLQHTLQWGGSLLQGVQVLGICFHARLHCSTRRIASAGQQWKHTWYFCAPMPGKSFRSKSQPANFRTHCLGHGAPVAQQQEMFCSLFNWRLTAMLMYEALHRDIAVKAWCRICNDDKQKLEEANLVLGIFLGLGTIRSAILQRLKVSQQFCFRSRHRLLMLTVNQLFPSFCAAKNLSTLNHSNNGRNSTVKSFSPWLSKVVEDSFKLPLCNIGTAGTRNFIHGVFPIFARRGWSHSATKRRTTQ